jgi:divalent metal cation (Fe/Co/Zn/Cd) transporter
VTVHSVDGRWTISLDLEVDSKLPLGTAHDIASKLEAAVREELGPDVEVETHIEPIETDDVTGRDAPPERIAAIGNALADLLNQVDLIDDVHDVRVRETDDGEIVNFHCHLDPAVSIHVVHEKVDELERALRQRFPSVKRVIGHAEPATAH